MRAKITWKRPEDGGRSFLPTGLGSPPYSPIVRFRDNQSSGPPATIWSLSVEKLREVDDEYEWLAEVYFRVGEAPHDELRPGREFELYEGAKSVAVGQILE